MDFSYKNNCSYLPHCMVNYDKCCCNNPKASEGKTCKDAKLIIDECPGRITATCVEHDTEENSCHDINYVKKNEDNYNKCCNVLDRDSKMEEICKS